MKKAMIIGLLLFGMNTQAKTIDPIEKTSTYHCHHKAEYYAIRALYEDGKISLTEAQRKWQKALRKLKKEAK